MILEKETVIAVDKEAFLINGKTKTKKVGKHTGACAVDIIKEKLESIDYLNKIVEIHEEAFVQGFNSQFDLLMVKRGAKKITHRCFRSEDVLVVLEVKYAGTGYVKASERRKFFIDFMTSLSAIKQLDIDYFYITIHENCSQHSGLESCWKNIYKDFEDRAFCLCWDPNEYTNDWERLTNRLKDVCCKR